eukprot:CAMPEP_0118647362 /NCGR_PEP_ID=MMETSP0785-20121206/8562_1 /TAXON_ID=91992 /ORGANISM="Bolidomonas pacifica, Strain CCMP 1866" /LENGTH=542 /DNA_ID=CAMNT_0006539443 /DNA_START=110 /DNA_END=1735 /DNA_ORIENTATION=-
MTLLTQSGMNELGRNKSPQNTVAVDEEGSHHGKDTNIMKHNGGDSNTRDNNTLDINTGEEDKEPSLKPFYIITICYLLFTITDGAIRMIILLFAYSQSFSAMEVAVTFTLYELAGVFTNLGAGVAGARWGIKPTLITGLSLQLFSYGLLFAWNEEWERTQAIVYVTFASMFGGIAKDLTKLGGKTVTKLVTKEGQKTRLFKLVSLLTGMKNSLKGVGYFLGSALIQVNYYLALGVMMSMIVAALPFAIFGLERNLGTAKKSNANFKEIFKLDNRNLNYLSLARLFLFASRDFWFEVPLPFYLRSPRCDELGVGWTCSNTDVCTPGAECKGSLCVNQNVGGGCGGLGFSRILVGAILGAYIILYGQVQSWTPQLVTGPLNQTPPNKLTEVLWGTVNVVPTLVLAIALYVAPSFTEYERDGMIAWIITIVVLFAVIFAVNSSIHSYLVVKYAKREKVAVSVGFYYMSNAAGRLLGTLGSGVLYSYVGADEGVYQGTDGRLGLAACMLAGTLSSVIAAGITTRIDDQGAGLICGRKVIIKEELEW